MVAVFNFGGQYAHLISRRVRELGARSDLVSPSISIEELKKLNPEAFIFSGSPFSVYDKNAPKPDLKIYSLGIPILGICYGHQLFAYQLNGKVSLSQKKQFGRVNLKVSRSPLFAGLSGREQVWFSHGDHVNATPPGFKSIASTSSAKIAAMEDLKRKFFSVQFHPEVTHTPKGMQVLSNFLFKIAKVKKDWDLKELKKTLVENLRQEAGSGKVVLALSGGVDSLVASALLKEAIATNLHLVFIDTGLLRKYDLVDLEEIAKKVALHNLHIVDAKSQFLDALEGVIDPEKKRKFIAKVYFEILEEEARKVGNVKFLAQGTIYPDRIESALTSMHADKIKSHHNVTLPLGLKLKIIEPLRELYKDEVRKLGKILKIPENFLMRHPFPGPGLAIRILGEVTKERVAIVQEADEIFISELKKSHIYNNVAQALVALLPVKSVGVMGDSRTYSYVISLRAVDTLDFMTADWSKIPDVILGKVASRIVNEVRGVNRVLYDITQKPPATIEYE